MKLTIPRQQNRDRSLAAALEMEAAVLVHVAFWLLLLSMFHWGMGVVPVLLMVLLPLAMVLLARRTVFTNYLVFFTMVLSALVVLVGYKFFSNGFLHMLNLAGGAVNETAGFRFVPFATTIPAGRETLYVYAAEAVLMLLTSAVVGQAAVHDCMLPVFLMTAVPVAAGLFLLLKPSLLLVLLFLGALLLFFVHCVAGNGGSGFSQTGILWQAAGSVLAFLALFLLLFYNYSGSASVQKLRNNVADRIETVRYAPETEGSGMTDGNLNRAGDLSFDGTLLFELSMDKATPGYYRDFVGSRFAGGIWKPLSADAMTGKYMGLDQWLAQRGFYPWLQLGRLFSLDDSRTGPSRTITVENVGLYSDKVYLNYEAVPTDDLLKQVKPTEQGFFSKGWKGLRNYTFTSYAPLCSDYGAEDLTAWTESLSGAEGYDAYQVPEAMYRSFVHDNYLEIDDAYLDIVSETGISRFSNSRYQDIVHGVRKYLQDNFEFSEKVDLPGKGEDSLVQFASSTHAGYDAHFATLAALLFRSAGVPSRYMEGYYLSGQEMGGYKSGKSVSLSISDEYSHAWVEIYEDGIGWVPVEVTPGYFTLEEEETSETKDTVKKVHKESPRPYYDGTPLQEEPEAAPPEAEKETHGWVFALVALLSLVALLAGGWFGGRRAVRDRIAKADGPEATRFGYRFLLWLLGRRKYPVNKEDPYALVGELGEPFRSYLDAVYRDAYSAEEEQLTPEERKAAADYVLDIWDNGKKR